MDKEQAADAWRRISEKQGMGIDLSPSVLAQLSALFDAECPRIPRRSQQEAA